MLSENENLGLSRRPAVSLFLPLLPPLARALVTAGISTLCMMWRQWDMQYWTDSLKDDSRDYLRNPQQGSVYVLHLDREVVALRAHPHLHEPGLLKE